MFVYMTVCLVNGKCYIGKYENSEQHSYLGSGKLFTRALRKYGRENFTRTILERYNCVEDCRAGEKRWIRLFNAVESSQFYNIAEKEKKKTTTNRTCKLLGSQNRHER